MTKQIMAMGHVNRDNGRIATLLRNLLAWLDGRGSEMVRVPMLVPAPEPEAIEAPEDDGLLKPSEIAIKVGALIWAHRSAIDVSLVSRYKGTINDGNRHVNDSPFVEVRIPGGIVVKIRDDHYYGQTEVVAPDGQSQIIPVGIDFPVINAYRSILVLAIVERLGLEDLFPDDMEDDGTQPMRSHPQRLGQAIGRYVESRTPVLCKETYVKRHRAEISTHNPKGYVDEEIPSEWLSIGEDVLLRMEVREKSEYSAWSTKAQISHPTMGTITIEGDDVHKGLERRKSTSLAEALGMALELPAHLPMPRGNAQAARILRLCREAVAAEPDLKDASGTPIRPLVDQHLPELMRRHAAASAIARTEDLASIDAELMDGIDRVRRAVEEALSCSAVSRRQALQTQLRFLEMRHPDPQPLLEAIPATGVAA